MFFLNKKAESGKMTKPPTLNHELVVLPDCHLPFTTGTPGENEHLIKKEEKEYKRKLCLLKKSEVNKTKHNTPAKNSTKKKKVAKRHLDF
ncbi:hypothetical protein AVEN_11844-1 [Araneus ventricosus]|uniref:Uncharacterized protein n=1 Tax=Araneus ventricosus TaxID=182803 RepID=A0A4Y2RD31_ARAVE|nr:hypothetical protein AVEN_11844-1 [Araneus ventricosus]